MQLKMFLFSTLLAGLAFARIGMAQDAPGKAQALDLCEYTEVTLDQLYMAATNQGKELMGEIEEIEIQTVGGEAKVIGMAYKNLIHFPDPAAVPEALRCKKPKATGS
jgi:hypothetical protein